ncbi:MAG TPA: LysM peptidoglycan-binding domain-containing protein [Myxococcales bacterium]|nr:LysM peptidoglycan-binding domain-containing protein [Myxococcales bacterium]
MKRRVALILTVLAVLFTAPVYAQYDQDDRYGPDIVTSNQPARPAGTYIVKDGDTLWDLSYDVFGDGLYWPTLWSYNPQITNPHWIFPDDLLYLKPRLKPGVDRKVVYAKSRYTHKPKLVEVLARFTGFVSERSYKESGKIHFSREEKRMLGEFDEAYVKFTIPKKILPGEEFTIYRPIKKVIHPRTGRSLGWLIQHLGVARVLNIDKTKTYVKSLILQSHEEIVRGDLLTKRVWNNELVVPVENQVSLWSQVVDTFKLINQIGEYDYIIIDKGYKQKIRRGNRLIIRWRGDGHKKLATRTKKKMPWENMGEVMVIEPFENTALCIVTRAIKEVERGGLLELVRGY